jgi:hypothetical protein
LPQLLDTTRSLIGRSSKLAVALAVGGLVPWLLVMIDGAAPILRVKMLEIIRRVLGLGSTGFGVSGMIGGAAPSLRVKMLEIIRRALGLGSMGFGVQGFQV